MGQLDPDRGLRWFDDWLTGQDLYSMEANYFVLVVCGGPLGQRDFLE